MLKLRIRTTAAQQAKYMVFACATMSLAVQFLYFPKDLMNHSHDNKCQDWFRLSLKHQVPHMFSVQAGLVPRLLHRILPPQVPSHLLSGALQARIESTVSREAATTQIIPKACLAQSSLRGVSKFLICRVCPMILIVHILLQCNCTMACHVPSLLIISLQLIGSSRPAPAVLWRDFLSIYVPALEQPRGSQHPSIPH